MKNTLYIVGLIFFVFTENLYAEDNAFIVIGKDNLVFELVKNKTSIGRAKSNDIVMNNKYVSRKHLAIIKDVNKFFLVDLNSTNGTCLNGMKLSPGKYANIVSGDTVSLTCEGPVFQFKFK